MNLRCNSKDFSLINNDFIAETISVIRRKNLTYCGFPKLENIAEAIGIVQQECVPGIYVEAGVALGGSAILIGRLKPPEVVLHLYDTFAGIPAPSLMDGQDAHERFEVISSGRSSGLGDDIYYGYQNDLVKVVRENLCNMGLNPEDRGIKLIKGLLEDSLFPESPVAFAHIDVDWYQSVRTCIERISPKLSPGGIMVFDDYSSYSGCRRAVDEWLSISTDFDVLFLKRSLAIVRKSSFKNL